MDDTTTNNELNDLRQTLQGLSLGPENNLKDVQVTTTETQQAPEFKSTIGISETFSSGGVSEIKYEATPLEHNPVQFVSQDQLGYTQAESTPAYDISSTHGGTATLLFDQNVQTGQVSAIEVNITQTDDLRYEISLTDNFISDANDLRDTRIADLAERMKGYDENKSLTDQTLTVWNKDVNQDIDNGMLVLDNLRLLGGGLEENMTQIQQLEQTPVLNATTNDASPSSPSAMLLKL